MVPCHTFKPLASNTSSSQLSSPPSEAAARLMHKPLPMPPFAGPKFISSQQPRILNVLPQNQTDVLMAVTLVNFLVHDSPDSRPMIMAMIAHDKMSFKTCIGI